MSHNLCAPITTDNSSTSSRKGNRIKLCRRYAKCHGYHSYRFHHGHSSCFTVPSENSCAQMKYSRLTLHSILLAPDLFKRLFTFFIRLLFSIVFKFCPRGGGQHLKNDEKTINVKKRFRRIVL